MKNGTTLSFKKQTYALLCLPERFFCQKYVRVVTKSQYFPKKIQISSQKSTRPELSVRMIPISHFAQKYEGYKTFITPYDGYKSFHINISNNPSTSLTFAYIYPIQIVNGEVSYLILKTSFGNLYHFLHAFFTPAVTTHAIYIFTSLALHVMVLCRHDVYNIFLHNDSPP